MSLGELSSRAIVGRYYERLEAKPGMEWIDAISNYFTFLRRDKTGQIMVRVDEFAARANTHWASLLSTTLGSGG